MGAALRGGAPELDVDAMVALELLLHILEQKVERLCLPHLPRRSQLLREGQEFMVVAAVVEELCRCMAAAQAR